MYKLFGNNDTNRDIGIVTSGIWQDGASSITTFFTSSTQYTNTGDYNVDLYRYDPANNSSASVQFGVALTICVEPGYITAEISKNGNPYPFDIYKFIKQKGYCNASIRLKFNNLDESDDNTKRIINAIAKLAENNGSNPKIGSLF